MTDTVLTYRGRPITDLTKGELVDALTWAFQEIEYQRKRADRLLNVAALSEPQPEGPTDEELRGLARKLVKIQMDDYGCVYDVLPFARAVLARFGRPAPLPS